MSYEFAESPVRYFGIEVDDALEIAEQLRCNLAGLVATAEPDGRRPAKSSPSSPPPNSLESGHSDLPKLVDTQ